ncbi:MAG TPA: VIT domain-containing protein [Gemmataceae bacterium]|jgi:predicted Zn-dependent protease
MNPIDDDRDEQQVEAFLSAAARDAAPPDRAFLERLRQQSTDVFAATANSLPLRQRGRLMTARSLRLLAAAAAVLFVIGPSLAWWLFGRDSNPALARVLDNTARASNIHCQLVRDGETFEVWAEASGRLRRDNPDGTYQIAADGRLWRIDEKANRATSGQSPYHRDAAGSPLDLFALLELPVEPDRASLSDAQAVARIERDGVECLVYRLEVQAVEGPIEIEALVNRRTKLLHSLQAKKQGEGEVKPSARLDVLAYNQAIPKEKFVVRDTLTEDGRVGKVADVQGVVGIKPVMHTRWTPLHAHLLLKPGDWLRTDLRGANAADVRLVKRTRLVLGPGTLLEIVKPDQVRLLEGELEITVPADAKLELLGPGKQSVAVKGTMHYRLDREILVAVREEPRWLKAFKGKTSDESIGSLIARVDGRNVPLTVGQHKVTVDVRDQIARTEIEESFVNHTDGVLEGVFHFPLPPGASVSGFGMWIGDKLVEADIVEKQRAREIYETILQEKRDPGLLEWTGGNIFKARVYPIFAHTEKRIKISYTQVLPFKGGSYRYNYALQSDLLQLHPLRELSLDVKVHSAAPLKNVTCPTHATRLERTAHSAHIEFTAQEYSPTRDFEVVIEPDGKQADVVLIPHRRADYGYFMLQLTPPAAGDDERDLLADGEPLHLIVVADTSASMDAHQRTVQANFVSALLSCLTPKDTINLAACDVECDWVFEKAVPATPSNLVTARQFLFGRTSLGWTDLDKAFASALKQCSPNTHVVYVGDGIITTGDADAVAFTKRLRRLYEESGKVGTFHAVSPGTSYEAGILKTIASLGGGSLRPIGGEQTPAAVAFELLGEITRPTLRDLKVEFRGLRTARVYPAELPNLSAGAQHILLGRYLPEGRDQVGEVVVTGTRDGKPVRFSTSVALKDAERGNSFIPRLWARMHLDHLLEKGSSQAIHDEIIALSEEYQIITPYTSLLVLESDADRERFAVKRTFRMRDGEKFFAEGRDNANYELKQQQMKRAGDWRLGLHRRILRQFATLGRDPRWFRNEEAGVFPYPLAAKDAESYPLGRLGENNQLGYVPSEQMEVVLELKDTIRKQELVQYQTISGRVSGEDLSVQAAESALPDDAEKDKKERGTEVLARQLDHLEALSDAKSFEAASRIYPGQILQYDSNEIEDVVAGSFERGEFQKLRRFLAAPTEDSRASRRSSRSRPGWYLRQSQWLDALFPSLPPAVKDSKRPQAKWPAEVRALAHSLLRTEKLAKITGGIEIVQRSETFDVRWNDLSSRSRVLALIAADSWLTRAEGDNQPMLVNWCDGRERGVFSPPFQLGRVRAAVPQDQRALPLDLSDYSLSPLDRAYVGFIPTLEAQKDGRTLLILKQVSSPTYETRFLIDTTRHAVVRIEQRTNGKATATTRFDDFIEVAGCWWAQRVEITDDQGRVSSRTTRSIKPLSADAVAKRMKGERAGADAVQFLHLPAKTVAEAKRALAADKASFDDHFALLRYFAGSQQWTRTMEHLRKCEALAVEKPGVRWLRTAVLQVSRRHEELRQRLLDEAKRLAKHAPTDTAQSDEVALAEHLLAEHLVGQASQVLQANESLALLDQLRPIYVRQPAYRHSMKNWTHRYVYALQQTGQMDEALRLQKQMAVDWPHDYSLQQQYVQALANAGDYPAAYAWIKAVLDKKARWLPGEEESLRNTHTQLLEAQGHYPELVDYLAEWVKQNPQSSSPYAQYLSALIRNDQIEKADTLLARWLNEGQARGELTPAVHARVQAAVSQALGQGHNLHTNRIEERWLKPLADAALFFVRRNDTFALADRILSSGQFQQTDEFKRVREALLADLTTRIDTLNPTHLLQPYLHWIGAGTPTVWKQIGDGLHKRWSAENDAEKKHRIGQALVQALSHQDNSAVLLAFKHEQWQKGPAQFRTRYARELFDTLLSEPWSAEHEDEAFTLLDKLTDSDDEGERLRTQVADLYQLTDRMIDARQTAKRKTVKHPEKLTRIELRKQQEESLRQARAGFAERLQAALAKEHGPLAAWLKIERLYLLVLLDQDLPRVEADCWAFLGEEPRKVQEPAPEQEISRQLDDLLRERYLVTLMNLATRKGAEAALGSRLLKYFDRGIALEEDGSRWKQLKYELLIALDRPKELATTLEQWVRAGDADNHWRRSLAFVLAEQGRIPEAIKLLEAVEAQDELTPMAYRTLADWYLAANRRAAHERARLAMYKTLDEWDVHRMLNARLRPWQERGDGQSLPKVDQDVLLMFMALLDKASSPQQHLGLLQQFYQATHEFRLLTGLADVVVGHTAEKVYPLLGGMKTLLAEVGDEATVDELGAYLAKVRQRVQTPVDRRALDLLECLIERRAAELKNQAGPHAEAALAALQRAFKGEWSSGEPRRMADFLNGMGIIRQVSLAKEQLRQLEELHRQSAKGSFDRLHIARSYAGALQGYRREEDAITVLQATLDEHQQAHGGILRTTANDALGALISLLEGARHYERGEKFLQTQLEHPVHEQQRYWLTRRLYQLYLNAFASNGKVSLGSGPKLYQAVERKLRGELATPDQEHRRQLIDELLGFYSLAQAKRLDGVRDDLRAFAFKQLPDVLKRQTNNYPSIVSNVAQRIHDIIGPRDAITFLLDRIEYEPAWFRFNNQDGWSRFSWTIAQWWEKAKDLGDLEERLLPIVLSELRRDLETRQYRNRVLYHRSYSSFWTAKEGDFAKVAEEVLAKHPQSGHAAAYIAEYLYHGLHRYPRAIEVLLAAHKGQLLDDAGQFQLVHYLHGQNRWAESIPVLQPLVARRPEHLSYRIALLSAYFRTGQQADLLAFLKETDAFFHEKGRWREDVLAALASSCLENKLYTQSAAYFNEVIPLHQRTKPRRGIGDGVLSRYYTELARAYAGLGKTVEAVEAASGAIVSWGPTHRNRAQAIEALKQVLHQAPNLDRYVASRDIETVASGLDSALVRKTLGQVYLEKGAPAKAVPQLQLSIGLQPNDLETHRLLTSCFDKLGEEQKAVSALLQAAEASRRDIKLYQDLGRRLASKPKEAERAYTSIVEVMPSESEGHALLAEVRQQQDRWAEAVTQWEQVARIRALEPTGLLKLAAAQVHLRQWDQAEQTLRKVGVRQWPPRFGEVRQQVRELEEQIKKGRGQ